MKRLWLAALLIVFASFTTQSQELAKQQRDSENHIQFRAGAVYSAAPDHRDAEGR
ncbi:MAG TPA: hypothetical protein VLA93_00610 [Pyrinomonadaceae bacterium]|nr:hypothetical protein [Pyrinomonadaceae bacterium]